MGSPQHRRGRGRGRCWYRDHPHPSRPAASRSQKELAWQVSKVLTLLQKKISNLNGNKTWRRFTSWMPQTRSGTADISVDDVYDMHDYHQEASHHLGREYEKGKDSTEQKNGKGEWKINWKWKIIFKTHEEEEKIISLQERALRISYRTKTLASVHRHPHQFRTRAYDIKKGKCRPKMCQCWPAGYGLLIASCIYRHFIGMLFLIRCIV